MANTQYSLALTIPDDGTPDWGENALNNTFNELDAKLSSGFILINGNAVKIQGKPVSGTGIGNNTTLVYDLPTQKFIFKKFEYVVTNTIFRVEDTSTVPNIITFFIAEIGDNINDGTTILIYVANTNTDAVKIQVSLVTPKDLRKNAWGESLVAGDLVAHSWCLVTFNQYRQVFELMSVVAS